MTRLSAAMLALTAWLATTAMIAKNDFHSDALTANETQFATDGAFRDGLYLGQFSAARGQASRPGVGRWSTERDRAAFAAGYRQGYGETAVSAAGAIANAQSTQ